MSKNIPPAMANKPTLQTMPYEIRSEIVSYLLWSKVDVYGLKKIDTGVRALKATCRNFRSNIDEFVKKERPKAKVQFVNSCQQLVMASAESRVASWSDEKYDYDAQSDLSYQSFDALNGMLLAGCRRLLFLSILRHRIYEHPFGGLGEYMETIRLDARSISYYRLDEEEPFPTLIGDFDESDNEFWNRQTELEQGLETLQTDLGRTSLFSEHTEPQPGPRSMPQFEPQTEQQIEPQIYPQDCCLTFYRLLEYSSDWETLD